jgi:hypothetical protein
LHRPLIFWWYTITLFLFLLLVNTKVLSLLKFAIISFVALSWTIQGKIYT